MKFTLTAAFVSTILLGVTALPQPDAPRLQRRDCDFPTVPLLRAYSSNATDHFYTIDAFEMKYAVTNLGYHQENNAATVHPFQTPITIPLYRLYSPSATDHFYTTSAGERDNATHVGYIEEGIAAYVYETQLCGTVPLYRMYSYAYPDHFYTTDVAEKDNAINKLGYTYEGITAYVNPQL
ncbi:hypothetical protein BD311DRAFT_122042 [Dichomitus squalens]|uniref:DUF5648 domain-containing protein n=1 Tax=Dichomitus squalens TaxID=114155 RepID=A0A4V2K162_9APHY|nr:hypothetical protein BD311DRAFT_122042 [Dichomitus squalens]